MGVQGFNIGSNKKRIEEVKDTIQGATNIVKNITEEKIDEYTLDMGLRPPTDKEVIRQYEEDGYRIVGTDEKRWHMHSPGHPNEEAIEIVEVSKPEEGKKLLYFRYNEENKEYELLEGYEEERVIRIIDQFEETLGGID